MAAEMVMTGHDWFIVVCFFVGMVAGNILTLVYISRRWK